MLYSLGREDQSVVEWTKAVGPLVDTANDFPVNSFGSFVSTWAKSISYVGESELYARRAERYEVFELDEAVRHVAVKRFEELNAIGIEGLEKARGILTDLRADLAVYEEGLDDSQRKRATDLGTHRSAVLAQFAEIEMKRSDAEQLRVLVDEAIERAENKGLHGLSDWMDEKLAEGIAARQRDDRGAQTNFAIWKLVAVVALLIALGIAFWIHCGWFSCSVYSRNNYIAAILTTAGLWWC